MTDFTQQQNFDELLTALKLERNRRRSALRTPTVVTVDPNKTFPQARTMVLRSIDIDKLVFFTDIRSNKCSAVKHNSSVTVHCYLPKSRTQLQFNTTGRLIQSGDAHPRFLHWQQLGLNRAEDYATDLAPGTVQSEPDYTTTLASAPNHFTVLLCQIEQVELLVLGNPHRRCQWSKSENNWIKEWMTP